MDIRVLKYFLMVAKEQNITKAAQLLHITQPTLSKQLKALEEELKVNLFERSNHSIYLTNEGNIFRRRAREVVDLSEKAICELCPTRSTITGEISIGCTESKSMDELSEIIIAFKEHYPLVKFKLYNKNNNDIKKGLEEGTLDLGLILGPVSINNYDFVKMNDKDELGVLVNKDSELGVQNYVKPKDLIGISLISTMDELIDGELMTWLGDYSNEVEPVIEYDLINNVASIVKKKAGVAVCLNFDYKYDDLCFIPFKPKLQLGYVLT